MSSRLATLALALPLLAAGWGLAADLEVRVFTLRHCDAAEASQAVRPLLSEEGSLTVQSRGNRLSVQDRPEVVERIAEFLAGYDVPPPEFRLRLLLLRASSRPRAGGEKAELEADLARRLGRMFRYRSYLPLGSVEVHGRAGDEVSVAVADGYRVSFQSRLFRRTVIPAKAVRPAVARSTPAHGRAVRPPARPVRPPRSVPPRPRLRLEHLQLLREVPRGKDALVLQEVLRTSVIISAGQRVVLGAAASEQADQALVLVIQAREPRGEEE